ncbi:MAG: hypothetical protein KF690_06390 [Bacteroidetes bacterium]|nr:hypothetical protein [Bacteroidota bacterium]
MANPFEDIILRRFPHNEAKGFFRKPDIPNGPKARVLNDYTRVNPNDVLAFYRYGSLLGSSSSLLFTPTHLWHPKGSIALADLKGASVQEKTLAIAFNAGGAMGAQPFKCDTAEDAAQLAGFLENLAMAPKAEDLVQQAAPKSYEGYSPEAVQWLEIRDEVMRTIDLLSERFQDGRLNLLEYEEKKADLLSRL